MTPIIRIKERIIYAMRWIIKNIRRFTDTKPPNIDDIPPMRYPKGHEEERKNFVNPFAKYNSTNSRIRYKKR